MIPLKDDNPIRTTPIVTIALVVACVIVFLYEQFGLGNDSALNAFFDRYSFDYAAFARSVSHGGLTLATITPLFTHMFLHANWLHIGGNMLYLWIFGNNVEDTLGKVRFILFYLACGVIAAAAHILSAPDSAIQTVGASGAIAGLMGAYLILFPQARILSL